MASKDSAARAAAYEDMVDLLQRRHIKGALEDRDGGVCLVGAINRVVPAQWERKQYEREVLQGIWERTPLLKVLAAGSALAGKEVHLTASNEDGGMAGIEIWNDTPWRRTKTAVAVLQELAAKYRDQAKEELIQELQAALAQLRADKAELEQRVRELEARVTELEAEVGFWKRAWHARRARVSANQLRFASAELQELDDELNQTLADLTREAQPAQ